MAEGEKASKRSRWVVVVGICTVLGGLSGGAGLLREIRSVASELSAAEQTVGDLESEIAELRVELGRVSAANGRDQDRVARLETLFGEAERNVLDSIDAELETRLDSLEQRVDGRVDGVVAARLNRAEAEVESWRSEVRDLADGVDRIGRMLERAGARDGATVLFDPESRVRAATHSTIIDDATFSIRSSRRRGDSVVLEVVAVSETDGWVQIRSDRSTVFFESGYQHVGFSRASSGNVGHTGTGRSRRIRIDLPPGTPVIFEVEFTDVTDPSRFINAVVLPIELGRNQHRELRFEGIDLK